jgi:hypothetical protein
MWQCQLSPPLSPPDWLVGVGVVQIFAGMFRCCAAVFSLFVAVLETEWGFIIRFWKVGWLVGFVSLQYLLLALDCCEMPRIRCDVVKIIL